MNGRLIRTFTACALGAGLAFTAQAEDAAIPADASLSMQVCPSPTLVVSDEKNRPWIAVDAVTRDGVAVKFDVNLSYRMQGATEISTIRDCSGLTPHIMGMAKVAYGEEILATDYTALPGAAAGMMRKVAQKVEDQMRAVMGPTTPAITGMGIRDVVAPGLDENYAQAMMTGRLQLPPYNKPRFTAVTYEGAVVEYKIDYSFAVAPQAYDYFGPVDSAVRTTIDEAVQRELQAATLRREKSCVDADHEYIEAQAYADAAKSLAADHPGLSLLSLKIASVTFPADMSAPGVMQPGNPICIKGLAP